MRTILFTATLLAVGCDGQMQNPGEPEPGDTAVHTLPIDPVEPQPDTCDAAVASIIESIDAWSSLRSCGFGTISLANGDATAALAITLDLPDDRPFTNGETFSTTWDPKAGARADEVAGSMSLDLGSALQASVCNDVMPDDPPTIDAQWVPVDGFMTLEVTDDSEDSGAPFFPFYGELRIEGVTLGKSDDDDLRCELPDLVIEDVYLGWLPG